MNRIEYWKQFIKSSDIDTLAKDLNNSWNPNTKTYDSYTPLKIELLNEIKEPLKDLTVLDFGCGLGRNTKNLSSIFKKVISYDLPEMVDKFKELHGNKYEIYDKWNDILQINIDIIFDCTVFQHLDIELLDTYLNTTNARYIYCHTRCYNDTGRNFQSYSGGINLFKHIVNNERYKSYKLFQNINPLAMDETHYDILYIR